MSRKPSPYLLESEQENNRLEHQSSLAAYNLQEELQKFKTFPSASILDAGCGSGVLLRFLEKQYPKASLHGCDLSENRLSNIRNTFLRPTQVDLKTADLALLPYADHSFDVIFCRYVLEHIPSQAIPQCMNELYRCLKPGGQLWLIDYDGLFINLYPRTHFLDGCLQKIVEHSPVDFQMGRKLPHLLAQHSFQKTYTECKSFLFSGTSLSQEIELMRSRMAAASGLIEKILAGKDAYETFKADFLTAMHASGSVYFYNKFTAVGFKPSLVLKSTYAP